jgi:hypothetical protein
VLLLVLLAGGLVAASLRGRQVGRSSTLEMVVLLVRIGASWASDGGGCSLR